MPGLRFHRYVKNIVGIFLHRTGRPGSVFVWKDIRRLFLRLTRVVVYDPQRVGIAALEGNLKLYTSLFARLVREPRALRRVRLLAMTERSLMRHCERSQAISSCELATKTY